jgi:DNA-binding NarL/FixJ family response regulator
MKNIRILLCEDQTLVRSGIASLLQGDENIFVVSEAGNGNDMIKKYFETHPDLVITCIEMPEMSGTDAFLEIKETDPGIKLLFLCSHYTEQYIYFALKSGSMGLLDTRITQGELIYAIHEIMEGRKYFGAEYDHQKLNELVIKYDHKKKKYTKEEISEIDDKILKGISSGYTSSEIADKLFLSKHTIDAHRINLIKKYNLKNGHELLKFSVLYTEDKKIY